MPKTPVYGFAGVGMNSARSIWIGAGINGFAGFAMHWNGYRWTKTPRFWNVSNDVVPDRLSGVWLGIFGHWSGRNWIDATNWARPITGIGSAMLVKIPGMRGSYWGSASVTVRGSNVPGFPGVMIYGPMP